MSTGNLVNHAPIYSSMDSDTMSVQNERGKVTKMPVLQPAHQKRGRNHHPRYTTVDLEPKSTFFGGTEVAHSVNIPAHSVYKAKSMTLYEKITVSSNTAKLAPISRHFNKIELRVNGGSGPAIRTWYQDELDFALSSVNRDKIRHILRNAGYDDSNWSYEFEAVPASGTRVFTLPLLGLITDSGIHLEHLKKDLQFRFWVNSGIVVSGSGTTACTELKLIVESEMPDRQSELDEKSFSRHIRSFSYLDCEEVSLPSETVTASTKKRINLEQLHGHYAGLLLIIRSTGATNSSDGYANHVGLGRYASVDIESSSGTSLYGDGTPLPVEYVRSEVWANHFDSDWNEHHRSIFIPFCDNFPASYHGGVKDGSVYFDGSTVFLSVTPDAAGTSAVETINLTNAANDGGFYQLEFKGDRTAGLAHDANAAAIKSALEALPSFARHRGRPLTVTASGALTTDATLTFAPPQYMGKDVVHIVPTSLNDGAVAEKVVSETYTTQGIDGFATGSHDITVLAWKWRTAHVSPFGEMSVQDD